MIFPCNIFGSVYFFIAVSFNGVSKIKKDEKHGILKRNIFKSDCSYPLQKTNEIRLKKLKLNQLG